MILFSRHLVLEDVLETGFDDNNPVIGWHNIATPDTVTTTSAQTGYPSLNMANELTFLEWRGAVTLADEYVTIDTSGAESIDYVALAVHNLGDALSVVSIEEFDGLYWEEIFEETMLASNAPVIFRFTPGSRQQIRVRIQPSGGGTPPRIAVLYCGELLTLQRRIYVGHSPFPLAVVADVMNGISENGHFLGRIVTGSRARTTVRQQNLTAVWYRESMAPFIENSKTKPFFFAWRPGDYPDEVAYAWMTNQPVPQNQRANGMMSVELQMGGIAA